MPACSQGFSMAGPQQTRVVVTGVGVVSPIGIGNDRFWDSLIHNRSGIDFLSAVPAEGLPSAFVQKCVILTRFAIFATESFSK